MFKNINSYFLSFTAIQRIPEIRRQIAQIAKMIDLSSALFTTSPILNEATSCGSTTDRLKIPMYRPILLWSTRSLMIANGRDTREAQPIPTIHNEAKNTMIFEPKK